MYTTSFEYHRAGSADEAVRMLGLYGDDARVLAGGHSLLPLMKLRLARPTHLIDIRKAQDLSGIAVQGNVVAIGAATTYRDVETSALVQRLLPLLGDAAAGVGDPQVRNMGTIGGSLAHCDPGADLPAAALALGAELVVAARSGDRTIAADDFFRGLMATAIDAGELLREIRIPVPPPRSGGAYLKHPHPASGFAAPGVAAQVTLDANGQVQTTRVGLTGIGTHAVRAPAVERALVGVAAEDAATAAPAVAAAASAAPDGLAIQADRLGSAEFHRSLLTAIVRRALERALERARTA